MPNHSSHRATCRVSLFRTLIIDIVRVTVTVLIGAYLLEADKASRVDREDLLSRNR